MERNANKNLRAANVETHSQYCMISRYHHGDENGKSNAKFAKFRLSDEAKEAGFSEVWLAYEKTISAKEAGMEVSYDEDKPLVITRRIHSGDENAYSIYEMASVIVIREGDMGVDSADRERRAKIVAEDIQTIHNDKESKADWVEADGKVIIGRTHHGDENGSTDTTFARICIVDMKANKKYPLLLEDIKTLGECKESSSDFNVDSPEHDNTFELWTNPAWDLEHLEHTCVKSLDPKDTFVCAGGSGTVKRIGNISVPGYAYSVMNELRNGPLFSDSISILYGVQGVCHQMANRFLYPSGKSIGNFELKNRPKGYLISSALYGVYGMGYKSWREEQYNPVCNKYKQNHKSEANNTVPSFNREYEYNSLLGATDGLREIITRDELEGIRKEQEIWLNCYEESMRKYKFLNDNNEYVIPSDLTEQIVADMINEMNGTQNETSEKIKGVVGVITWAKLNDGSPDVFDLLSVEEALEYYAPYIKK